MATPSARNVKPDPPPITASPERYPGEPLPAVRRMKMFAIRKGNTITIAPLEEP
jgi:hypothetical protein